MKAPVETDTRGWILKVLAANDGLRQPMAFGLMRKSLRNVCIDLSVNGLASEAVYLEEAGYIACHRRKDIPGYEAREGCRAGGGRPSDILALKLTRKGLDLVQGALPADPGVSVE